MTKATFSADLEFGDEAWVIRRVHVDNQFIDDYGVLTVITEEGEVIRESDDDLIAVLPALA